jgi:hypothetical protein
MRQRTRQEEMDARRGRDEAARRRTAAAAEAPYKRQPSTANNLPRTAANTPMR